MNKHRFTHCGDLHLGAKPNHIDIRYDDFFDSFKELIEKSVDEHCEYILIAGDLFHVKQINSQTLLKTTQLLDLAINNNIKIIVIEGNHDKAYFVDEQSWLYYLKEKGYITLLTHKIEDGNLVLDNNSIYEDEYIRIIGIGYLGSTTSVYLKGLENKIPKSEKFTVLMLHAAINRLYNEDMGDINLDILTPLKGIVDYIALGHIHTKYEYEDFMYNPGSLENIRIKDGKKNEKKGYNIVSFEEKEKNVDFYNSKQRKIYFKNFKFENDMTIDVVEDMITNYDYNCDEQTVLSITLLGSVSFNPYVIKFEDIKTKIKEKYNLLYIEIENLINIAINEEIQSNYIDMKSFEEDAIKNYISINHPNIENIEQTTKIIQELKKALLDKKELDIIINNMVEDGDL